MIRFFLLLLVTAQEARLDENEYEKHFASHVKAFAALEKSWKRDPVTALKTVERLLKAIETDLLPLFPRHIETRILVRLTRGIDKGETREHPFYPYRLAGEIALAAGRPERAVAFLKKSPSSAALLLKPAIDLRPFLDQHDFIGALELLRGDTGNRVEEVRQETIRHQKARTAVLAAVLPRFAEPDFRKEHLEPCIHSCTRVPLQFETDEIRWIRRLDGWLEKRDPAEFDRLAIAAAKFAPDFHVLCDVAQENRLREIENGVEALIQAPRADRVRLLDQIGGSERSFYDLSATRERPELRTRLAQIKSRMPIDEEALAQAREGTMTIAEIRRLSGELERLWISDRRPRLSVPDQKELALHLAIYRCCALFLEGKSVEETSKDACVIEAFRAAPPLPAGLPPKVAAVRDRTKAPQ
jgi:hypothetical protein